MSDAVDNTFPTMEDFGELLRSQADVIVDRAHAVLAAGGSLGDVIFDVTWCGDFTDPDLLAEAGGPGRVVVVTGRREFLADMNPGPVRDTLAAQPPHVAACALCIVTETMLIRASAVNVPPRPVPLAMAARSAPRTIPPPPPCQFMGSCPSPAIGVLSWVGPPGPGNPVVLPAVVCGQHGEAVKATRPEDYAFRVWTPAESKTYRARGPHCRSCGASVPGWRKVSCDACDRAWEARV